MKIIENLIIRLYNTYPIFKKLDESTQDKIKNNLIYKNVNALDYIKSVENTCEGIPFVISGEINIYRINEDGNETNLYNMKAGDFCHEALSCILRLVPLDIIGQAIYNSEIIIIPISIFKEIFLDNIDFFKFIYIDLYKKFRDIIEEKENILHEPLDKRLWNYLTSNNSKYIYLTHDSLAKKLSTSREVISRKLKFLERQEKVKLYRGKIEILKKD